MPDSNAIPRTPTPDAEPSLKLRLEERLGLLDAIELLVYRSFGTPDLLRVHGRVREKKGVEGTTEKTSVWRNIRDTLHRLESDEIPGARVRARLGGRSQETTTDREGYFALELAPRWPLDPGWHEVELELLESVGTPASRNARGRVLIPSPKADFAVISDVDDTIIRSRSTDLLREIEIIFGEGARDRVAFPGIPALYRGLARGPGDRGENPIFYVSMSGWNLYDLFDEFMRINDIPEGPLFLSDLRVFEAQSEVMGSPQHKWEWIDLLMRVYHELSFVLIGDSGMHDPELYLQIVERHPGRVRAIYLHDVSSPERDEEVEGIARRAREHGVPVLRAANTMQVAEHAREIGLISDGALDEVRREVQRQQGESEAG